MLGLSTHISLKEAKVRPTYAFIPISLWEAHIRHDYTHNPMGGQCKTYLQPYPNGRPMLDISSPISQWEANVRPIYTYIPMGGQC